MLIAMRRASPGGEHLGLHTPNSIAGCPQPVLQAKSSLVRGRGILIETRDAPDEVMHPGSRPRPTPRERRDIAGGERGGQGSRRRDAARPQFGQDRRQAGGTSVSSAGLGLIAFGAGLDHLAQTGAPCPPADPQQKAPACGARAWTNHRAGGGGMQVVRGNKSMPGRRGSLPG